MKQIQQIIDEVSEKNPLIHCITNPISINQCANAILALGARPIMAEHPEEVEEITLSSDALLLNLGNITDIRMKSMLISSKAALQKDIPWIIDLVGVACSKLRRNFATKLINSSSPSLIKGNYSEIYAMYNHEYTSEGVDADTILDKDTVSKACSFLSEKHDTIVLASGKEDIIVGHGRSFVVKNGVNHLTRLTGTGCMLGAISASMMSVQKNIEAVVMSAITLGICSEKALPCDGNATFMTKLMDNLSIITDDDIAKNINYKEYTNESL